MTEIFKSKNYQNPSFMCDFFIDKEIPYRLRISNLLRLPPTRTVTHGLNSLTFRGSILWNTLADDIKNSENLNMFKRKIRDWRGSKCNCQICS